MWNSFLYLFVSVLSLSLSRTHSRYLLKITLLLLFHAFCEVTRHYANVTKIMRPRVKYYFILINIIIFCVSKCIWEHLVFPHGHTYQNRTNNLPHCPIHIEIVRPEFASNRPSVHNVAQHRATPVQIDMISPCPFAVMVTFVCDVFIQSLTPSRTHCHVGIINMDFHSFVLFFSFRWISLIVIDSEWLGAFDLTTNWIHFFLFGRLFMKNENLLYKRAQTAHIMIASFARIRVGINSSKQCAAAKQKRNNKVIINNHRVYSIGQMYFSSQFNCIPVPVRAHFGSRFDANSGSIIV